MAKKKVWFPKNIEGLPAETALEITRSFLEEYMGCMEANEPRAVRDIAALRASLDCLPWDADDLN